MAARNRQDSSYSTLYFNKPVLLHGESFKAIAEFSQALQKTTRVPLFVVSHIVEDKMRHLPLDAVGTPVGHLRDDFFRYGWQYKTDETNFPSGSYLVRAYAVPRESTPQVTNNPEGFEDWLIGSQEFYIATRGEYVRELMRSFGDTWDEPIYLHELKTEQLNELLEGWSLAQLKSRRSQGFLEMIEEILAIFMRQQIARLPFRMVTRILTSRFYPKVDLSKYMWLLSVLSPALADLCFFDEEIRLHIEADPTHLTLVLQHEGQSMGAYRPDPVETLLFDLVKDSVGQTLPMAFEVISTDYVVLNIFSEVRASTNEAEVEASRHYRG